MDCERFGGFGVRGRVGGGGEGCGEEGCVPGLEGFLSVVDKGLEVEVEGRDCEGGSGGRVVADEVLDLMEEAGDVDDVDPEVED